MHIPYFTKYRTQSISKSEIKELRINEKGSAIIHYKSGSIYQGGINQLKNKEGFGIQKWPDGALYEGIWRNDQANGKGIFFLPNGDYYEG